MNCSIYYCAINSKAKEVDVDYREMFIHLKNKRRLLFYTTSLTVYHKNTMVYYIYKQKEQKYVFFLGLKGVIDNSIIKDIFVFFEELQSVFNLPFRNNDYLFENLKLESAIVDYGFLNSWAIHKLTEHNFVKCSFPSYTAIENSSDKKSFDNIAKYNLVSKDIVEAIKGCSLVYVYNNSECKKIKWNNWVWDRDDIFNKINIGTSIAICLSFIGVFIYEEIEFHWGYIFTLIAVAFWGYCLGFVINLIFFGINCIISLTIYILKKLRYTKNFVSKSCVSYNYATDWFRENMGEELCIEEVYQYLGDCYFKGEGIIKDDKQAKYWWNEAKNKVIKYK